MKILVQPPCFAPYRDDIYQHLCDKYRRAAEFLVHGILDNHSKWCYSGLNFNYLKIDNIRRLINSDEGLNHLKKLLRNIN